MSSEEPKGLESHRLPARVFLNHAGADREIADWLRVRLRDAGADVWMDTSELSGGDRWKETIDKELWRRQFVVAVVTRNSIAPDRKWVHYEQQRGHRLLKTIIPCLFEDGGEFLAEGLLPELLSQLNIISFEPDRERGLQELINSIGRRLRRPGKELHNEAAGIQHAFIGRERDLQNLNRLINEESLQTTGRKIIAVVGMGGLGKTMLAEEFVRRLAFDYPGGVLIESRAGEAQSAQEVMRRWVEWSLGRPPERTYDESEVRALLTTFGEILVLFDDVSEKDFLETSALLRALPPDAVRLLTTRRPDIGDNLGAIRYDLEPMTSEDAMALAESRLRDRFGESSKREGLDFANLIREYEDSILELVRVVEGHPLALDLAIGACDYLAEIPEVLARLTASLEVGVKSFARDLALGAADSKASLASSLSQSLEDLERYDRSAGTRWAVRYCALGVLPDGSRAPKELLFALWGDRELDTERANAALKGLIRRSMLRVDQHARFYNHPIMRAYAMDLLGRDPEHLSTVRERYRRWVIDRAAEAYARPPESWIENQWLIEHVQQVRRELTSKIQESVGRLHRLSQPESPRDEVLELLRAMDPRLLSQGAELAAAVQARVLLRPEWGEEGLQCLRLGLACVRGRGLPADEVSFLQLLGRALARKNPKLATGCFSSALAMGNRIEDKQQVASILSHYGELQRTQGRWDDAMELLEEGLELHRRFGDPGMEATTLKSIGEIYWRKSDFEAALAKYSQAQQIYQDHQDQAGFADCLNKIGSVEFNRGNHRRAIEIFRQALELHQQLRNQAMEAEDKNDLGAAYRYLGENQIALGLFQEACEIDLRIGNLRHESIARSNMAGALSALGRFEDSIREARTAGQIAEDVGDPIPRLWSLAWQGVSLDGIGRFEEAETSFRKALEICRSVENPRGLAGVLGMLASTLSKEPAGRAEARDLLQEAIAVMEQHGLEQAFGLARIEDFRTLLAEL